MLERRGVQRGLTYIGGRISFNRQFSNVNCLVRNLSRNGAKLVFAEPPILPAEFDVEIPGRQESFRARIIWRTELQAGVAIIPAEASSVIPIGRAKWVRDLVAERDKLARELTELKSPIDA